MLTTDLYALSVAVVAIAVAAAVQGLTGSGFGLTAAPPLLLVTPALVPDTLLWLTVAVTGYTASTDRSSADRVFARRCVLAALPGTAVGALAATFLPQSALTVGIAAAVILAGCAGLAGLRIAVTPASTVAAGVAAGALNWTAALPGPPVVLVYRGGAATVRATLSRVFLLMSVVTLAARYASAQTDLTAALTAAALTAAVAVGVLVARPMARHISGALVAASRWR